MLLLLALIIFVAHSLIALEVLYAARHLVDLGRMPALAAAECPPLSIIVAARNEEAKIETALTSLLNLDYPDLEIIVVNDRSTDGTGTILARMGHQFPRLKIITIAELPYGWLGKNHALWQGARSASGRVFLFTDADIIMAPQTLRRAVNLLAQQQLDHLAVSPGLRMSGLWLNLLGSTFGFLFGLYTRCWRVADPRNRCHIGVGAFNLVRADAYHLSGGHQRIRLRPDDDLKLGKIIKDSGFRQQFAYGHELIEVEWYSSVREMIIGLEKNLFAGSDYRITTTLSGTLAGVTLFVWPYVALFLTSGLTWWLSFFSVMLLSLLLWVSARRFDTSRWQLLGFPLAVALLCGMSVRTMALNLFQGGICWRGTFYSLAELRKNRV